MSPKTKTQIQGLRNVIFRKKKHPHLPLTLVTIGTKINTSFQISSYKIILIKHLRCSKKGTPASETQGHPLRLSTRSTLRNTRCAWVKQEVDGGVDGADHQQEQSHHSSASACTPVRKHVQNKSLEGQKFCKSLLLET